MPFIETQDHTRLYYKDWGSGPAVVFVSSWSLGGDMWDYQTLPLSQQGIRCIALDRRGHGRSDDPGQGYDFDTLSDDLAALLETLDLSDVTLVGHSMGCAEITRYLSRYGVKRVTRVAFVSPIRLVQPSDGSEDFIKVGMQKAAQLMMADRPRYMREGTVKFFALGASWPLPSNFSQEMVDWSIQFILQASFKAILDCWYAMRDTDFTSEISALRLPLLIIHGDNDQSAPLALCGQRIAQAVPTSQLIVYPSAPHGLFLTERERLTCDLAAFIKE
jgi:non-heme chloroperoxidase